MRKLTTLSLVAAAVLVAGIGSAQACSYGVMDLAVNGNGHVVELTEDGDGNQVTGRVFGQYNELRTQIEGSCNVIVTDQDGSFTTVGTVIEGDHQAVAVLLSNGATVDLTTVGSWNTAMIDAAGGDLSVLINGIGNTVYIQKRG